MKKLFNAFIKKLEMFPVKIIYLKTYVFEWIDVYRKRELYKNVKWSNEQKREFDDYWIKNYGKKISPRWHKLYESINGKFDVTYLPDVIYSTKIAPKIIPYNAAKQLCDKAMVEIFAKAAGGKIPKTIILNSYGIFYDSCRNIIGKKEAVELVKNEKVVILKPTVGGSSGTGVRVLKVDQLDENGIEEIFSEYGENYIIQEKIVQNESFSLLHPNSINTIRLTTIAVENGVRHWPLALRIGTGESSVDNIHAGGIGIGVDDEGKLKSKAYRLGSCDCKETLEVHPDTGVRFEGYRLDGIRQMINLAHILHGYVPGIGVISWDFTVDIEGNPIVIEANMLAQGMWFSQIINQKGMSDIMLPLIMK